MEELVTILSLVVENDIEVIESVVKGLTKEQIDIAIKWASAEMYYASDNDVKRLKKPEFLGSLS